MWVLCKQKARKARPLPTDCETGSSQARTGWFEKKYLALTRIEPGFLERPAHTRTL